MLARALMAGPPRPDSGGLAVVFIGLLLPSLLLAQDEPKPPQGRGGPSDTCDRRGVLSQTRKVDTHGSHKESKTNLTTKPSGKNYYK